MPPSMGSASLVPLFTVTGIMNFRSLPRNSSNCFQWAVPEDRPITIAALPPENRSNESLNIAVEFAPSLYQPSALDWAQSCRACLACSLSQSRLPSIQASYSSGVKMPEPKPERKNSMPRPSLLPRAKQETSVLSRMVLHVDASSSQVVGGLAGSRPACVKIAAL